MRSSGPCGPSPRPPPSCPSLPCRDTRFDRRQFVKAAGVAGAALAAGAGTWGCGVPGPQTDQALPGPDPAERDLALYALDEARSAGAKYADARVSRHWSESISAREDRITGVSKSDSYGIGVRALVSGAWGFAATQELTRKAVARAAREAVAIARANDRVAPSETTLAGVDPVPDGRWVTPPRDRPVRRPDRGEGGPAVPRECRGAGCRRCPVRLVERRVEQGEPAGRDDRWVAHPADVHPGQPEHEHHGGRHGR